MHREGGLNDQVICWGLDEGRKFLRGSPLDKAARDPCGRAATRSSSEFGEKRKGSIQRASTNERPLVL